MNVENAGLNRYRLVTAGILIAISLISFETILLGYVFGAW
jgi:hypothetical protein